MTETHSILSPHSSWSLEESTMDYREEIKKAIEPDDREMEIKVQNLYRQFFEIRMDDWSARGPGDWICQWLELIA